jgi:hypothetical protein
MCEAKFSTSRYLNRHKKIHTEEGQKRQKKSEEYTAKLLIKFGIDFKREHRVYFSCNGGTFCKIDYLYIKNGFIFIIENDEKQHKTYPVSCELRRMMQIKSCFLLDIIQTLIV